MAYFSLPRQKTLPPERRLPFWVQAALWLRPAHRSSRREMWWRLWGSLVVGLAAPCLLWWFPGWAPCYVLPFFLLPSALWYGLAIRWLDRHQAWGRGYFPIELWG